jgi:peptidoglycan/xylan/chitin deacetylase (PgdA/CDA1 family)
MRTHSLRRWALIVGALVLALGVPSTPPAEAAAPLAELVTRGVTSSPPLISFTFDAGSDVGYTVAILDTLKANGIRADFGIRGSWAEQNPTLLRRIVAEGHNIINHTYDHLSFTGRSTGTQPLTQAQRWEQLDKAENVIKAITGTSTKPWFRPPYGDTDAGVQADAYARGYSTQVMWTIDSLGWDGLSAEEITQRVLSLAVPGAIVLFHVGAASQDANALQAIINGLRGRGYSFASVLEILPWRPFPNARTLAGQQYTDFFNRAAGQAEVDYWAGRLLGGTITPHALMASFFASTEFQRTVTPIARVYVNYLGRLPDPGGLQFWADYLRRGTPLAAVCDLMLTFPELDAVYGDMTDAEFVTALYRAALGRDPDPGGLGYWVGQLSAHRLTRGAVMAALSESAESVNRTARPITVTTMYAAMLRRTPDPDGLAFWSAYLATHPVADLVLVLFQSSEYRARFAY